MKEILKVLVGSQAHGLATSESDFDYRAVFVLPTKELLKLGGNTKSTNWIEGKEDNTSWELAHFLNMAVHCNPTILEVFLAPAVFIPTLLERPELGRELRDLFPYVWNSKAVMDAFIGYGLNQRKKFLDKKDARPGKYGVAYLRTLYQAKELLTTGTFTIKVGDTPIGQMLKDIKANNVLAGEIIQTCLDLEDDVREAYKNNSQKKTDLEPINEFLLKVRKEYWE